MKTYIANRMGEYCSPQISSLKSIEGDYESKSPFLIKYNGEDSIWLDIKPVNNADYVSTVIDPGWNVELCVGIKDAPNGDLLQIGK